MSKFWKSHSVTSQIVNTTNTAEKQGIKKPDLEQVFITFMLIVASCLSVVFFLAYLI